MLSSMGPNAIPAPLWTPTDTNLYDTEHGPMANLGTDLISVYKSFYTSGGNTAQLPGQFPLIYFQNGMIGVQVKSLGGNFNQFVTQLTDLGMQVTQSSSYYGLVDGYAPVSALPNIAQLPQTEAGAPLYKPEVNAEYQGIAYNEAETSLFADVARTTFNVDGTGVTLGVLSDSVNQYNGGLSASYKTGDLNPNSPVNVIQDGASGGTDEGRAMLENIHDIAPGSNLAFATAEGGDLAFANNIDALATQGKSNIIVDDVGYPDEPFFQDGLISQAVNTVTTDGVSYFSSARNEADHGYLSNFRAATGTVTGAGTGTFMNFDPNGGTALTLPVTVNVPNTNIVFQFDQPFQTQEPAGSPGVVTSQLNFYVLSSTGTVIASGTTNNVATQQPIQTVTVPSAGSYFVAIQVVSGPNPGHVEFLQFGQQSTNDLIVSQQYGSAGGTYYPTTGGHNAAQNTIGIGAVPWWAPAPYLATNPLNNEPFSSSGPEINVFSSTGVPLTGGAITILNPTVTAPDGGNTSFFEPGFLLNTTTPPIPGQPASATDLVPANQQNLPVFFGTSSAAPNAAAVAALMLQKVPSLTPTQIKDALITSATNQPMNGGSPGVWQADGGYGLINAIAAINAVDLLRVVSTNPANGSTVTVTPSTITVTFNKPVNFSSVLNAASPVLTFTSEPLGVTVNVGTPIAVDNPTDPTIIQWPFSFTKPAGTLANGAYTFSIQSPATGAPVVSEDGKDLVPSGPIKFTLADVTAPVVTKTTTTGRQVAITFSKALDPTTVTLSNIFVIRQDGAATWPPTAADLSSYVNLNNDPRTTISYNPQTNTVTLNYSGLPQTELPSDNYAIVVLSPTTKGAAGVTDIVGNALDGNFTGVFPSGANGEPADFIQNLGFEQLQAPVITTFVLTPTPTNDTGIVGDQNTSVTEPNFIGQLYSNFPGTVANLSVYIEFGGIHDGDITLGLGSGGRGFSGSYDLQVITDANGGFTFTAPQPLPEGFQTVQAVVVGQADSPPLPGYSSAKEDAFRIDLTPPQITGASFLPGGAQLPLPNGPQPTITQVSSLTNLSLYAVDPVNPFDAPFGTPAQVVFDALNPATAANISNYSLVNLSQNDQDESQYIATATFVPTNTVLDATGTYVVEYTGRIDVTFAAGLPAGVYEFIAHTTELQYPGITDAAGNPLNDITVPGEGTKDFVINFDVQPTPVYITGMSYESTYSSNGSTVVGGPQSYYELPAAGGTNTRDNVPAPPTAVVLDFSNPLPYSNALGQPINYTNDVQLIASANGAGSSPDGEFGNLGEGGLGSTGTGFTVLSNYTVTLYEYNAQTQTSVPVQAGGSGNRLVLQLNPGATLSADNYRVYIPNQVEPGKIDTRIVDIYNNQLDGENLGNQTSQPSPDFPGSPTFLPEYEDLLSSGVNRAPDMSGDGVAGGAFMTGFTVVNYGNVVFARPDYVENPLLPSTLSDGSMAKPYPVLAPEGDPNTAPANPNHDPNGGLNSTFFYQPGNFNVAYDRSGDGLFEQSALYAASQLSYAVPGTSQLGGPVVVVALPGIPQRNPITGVVTQAAFSLQAPAGKNATINNGSASVPFDTLLAFAAGSTLKLQNASLFVQNQGSALQSLGTATLPVNFTSYNDASIGGATNNNPDTTPHAGDWGGIVFRSYDEAIASQQVDFPVDGILVGVNGTPAISGADDAMSLINFTNIRYGGGAVPQATSDFYSAITAFNSRPMITNDMITDTGGTGGTEAAIGVDYDSLREDDTARGIMVRQVTVLDNSLNAIWLMSEANGFVEPTNAVPYPSNPTTLGGSQNYTLFAPLPYVVLAQLIVGQELLVNTGGLTNFVTNRLYVQPGVMVKFNKGSGLDLLNPGSSLNVGARSYINGYDQSPGNDYSPESPGFVEESAADPQVLFTSILDDPATTTLVPNPINVTGELKTPTLGPSLWGSVGIQSGGIAVINAATFKYGGGSVNTQDFTIPSQSALAFISDFTTFNLPPTAFDTLGSHVYITNNNFFDNFDAAMQIEPNGLLAGDPLRPLLSGHPFFRGNVMQGNGIDGLIVTTSRIYYYTANYQTYLGPREAIIPTGAVTQTVDTVWDATDLTYVLKGTIVLGPDSFTEALNPGVMPAPNLTQYSTVPAPTVTLTIQSALPGTLLADGETIPSPGQSVIVKMYNDETPNNLGAANLATSYGSTGVPSAENAGAGFILGVDDGVDPPGSPLLDPGVGSELRLLGIPGNQTTGQQRIPVIITSLRDGSVGTTVRGVKMYKIWNSAPVETVLAGGTLNLTTPTAGDGGYIYIGGYSMTEYDPTNPFDGSLINNANISYMSRIEVQGGGLIDIGAATGTGPFGWFDEKNGYAGPVTQLNSPMMFTISDSNLNEFSDAAVFAHSQALNALTRTWVGTNNQLIPPPVRGTLVGQPVFLYLYNDTIANSGQGVHINSNPTDTSTTLNSGFEAVLVNNTFYNDPFAIQTISPQYDARNINAHVNVLAMNNIFYGSSQVAVNIQGQAGESQLQYNLYSNDTQNILVTTNDGDFAGNVNPIEADPQFVDATAGNFDLEPTSPAIDQARSEIGPLPAGNAIFPTVDVSLNGGVITETRTDPTTLTNPNEMPGRDLDLGGFSFVGDPRQIVTLPGSGFFDFPDEYVPALTTDPNGYSTATQTAGTYNYAPISGQRDILGFIRSPQKGSGPGYGSSPFMDIGAYQYVNLHPPEVTAVTETPTEGATPVNFYTLGTSPAGTNQTPWSINISFNGPIDPNTINANTVELVDLGNNPAAPLDQPINLAGKLSYISDPSTSTYTLVINLAAAGLTLQTDLYQITLLGAGSPVIANPQGIALDGQNTVGGLSTGAQLPLPSGTGYPGSNFFDSFIINTTPPLILPGSLEMDPASDTNIVGDDITMTALPTFDGTISEPNGALVPLAGQTVYIDVGVSLLVNGVETTYFDPSKLPSDLSGDAQYIREDAGTTISGTGGVFQVTVGVDGANTGLVTTTTPLPDLFPLYNVGLDGKLSPLPGDDSGYYVARIRIVDQSGNESNPADPNAQLPFVVDKTAPTAKFNTPTQGQVITSLVNGQVVVSFTTNKNIDLTHFNAASIKVVNAGPDGILGTADDVTIPINPQSISVTYLDAGKGGKGSELISFATEGTLTNNLYQVTLLNTGADSVRDIAGNTLATPATLQFVIDVPGFQKNLFVGGSTFITNPTAPLGDRANPYPTISAAMKAAVAGDVVAVLPGVYTEQVTLKPLVKLYSADPSSGDSTVFTTSTGSALATVIRAPFVATPPTTLYPTISATGVQSFGTLSTEVAGFTIASPLAVDPAVGFINPLAIGVQLTNSNVVIDKDYIVDGGDGILVTTSGALAMFPQIYNDGIIGNTDGVVITDNATTSVATSPTTVINNDFAFNTIGLLLNNTAASPEQAYVASNIFWENHDQTTARFGYAIYSQTPNKVSLQNNMFFGNGASDTSQANATNDLGNGFDPALLGTSAQAALGDQGNYVGQPFFSFPVDPRPGSDGPAAFFINADFELTSASAAIDNAWEATAIPTDLLGNSQVKITGGGFGLPGYGPRDVGAFEFMGAGGHTVGGTFRVVTDSLGPVASGGTLKVTTPPTSITITFSGDANERSISATDLVLSGTAVDSLNPVHATSFSWIDGNTVKFNLAGQFNSGGTLDLSVPAGMIQSASGSPNMGYSDKVVIDIAAPPPVTPPPAPPPKPVTPGGPHHTKKPAPKKPTKHVVVSHSTAPRPKVVVNTAKPKGPGGKA